jgi:hypothetical protein
MEEWRPSRRARAVPGDRGDGAAALWWGLRWRWAAGAPPVLPVWAPLVRRRGARRDAPAFSPGRWCARSCRSACLPSRRCWLRWGEVMGGGTVCWPAPSHPALPFQLPLAQPLAPPLHTRPFTQHPALPPPLPPGAQAQHAARHLVHPQPPRVRRLRAQGHQQPDHRGGEGRHPAGAGRAQVCVWGGRSLPGQLLHLAAAIGRSVGAAAAWAACTGSGGALRATTWCSPHERARP